MQTDRADGEAAPREKAATNERTKDSGVPKGERVGTDREKSNSLSVLEQAQTTTATTPSKCETLPLALRHPPLQPQLSDAKRR